MTVDKTVRFCVSTAQLLNILYIGIMELRYGAAVLYSHFELQTHIPSDSLPRRRCSKDPGTTVKT